jgi:hypothetical protein
MHLYREKLESFNQYYKGTSSRENLIIHRFVHWSSLNWIVLENSISDWNICGKSSLYIFSVKKVVLHFSVFCKFLPSSTRFYVEIFTTNRTFCFIHSLKNRAKLNKSLKSYEWDNFQMVVLQSEWNFLFSESSAIFFLK